MSLTEELAKYGITGATEIVHNPSYEDLFAAEMASGLTGYDKGQLTKMGAVNVMTGIYTGRSPKDKFIVKDDTTKDTVWWTSDAFKNDNNRTRRSRHKKFPAKVDAQKNCRKYSKKYYAWIVLSLRKVEISKIFQGFRRIEQLTHRAFFYN